MLSEMLDNRVRLCTSAYPWERGAIIYTLWPIVFLIGIAVGLFMGLLLHCPWAVYAILYIHACSCVEFMLRAV